MFLFYEQRICILDSNSTIDWAVNTPWSLRRNLKWNFLDLLVQYNIVDEAAPAPSGLLPTSSSMGATSDPTTKETHVSCGLAAS